MKKLLQAMAIAALAMLAAGCNSNNIKFADEQVKQICIKHWDTDGNGKLSYEEAAAVTKIGDAFYDAKITSFDEFQYFTGVKLLYRDSFSKCSSLSSIVIPESVKEIGSEAFRDCESLEHIDLPDGITYISNDAFKGCTKLPVVDGIRYADYYAIEVVSSDNANHILKEGTRMVSDQVLTGIADKTGNVVIPQYITSVKDFLFEDIQSITEVNLPDGLTSIGNYSFRKCVNLSTLVIPASVKSIGRFAFFDCTSLAQVYCKATTPPEMGVSVFARFDMSKYGMGASEPLLLDCKIYVPRQSVDAYKAAEGWSKYAHAIVGYDF